MTAFQPFADDSAAVEIGTGKAVTIENGLTSISLYGELALTRDKLGLGEARQLKMVIDAIVAALETADLPDRIDTTPRSTLRIRNPLA